MVQRKIAVLRARHDSTWPLLPEEVFETVITKGSLSLARFWSDVTDGELELDLRLYDWVEVDLPQRTDAKEVAQVAKAVAAVRATNPAEDPVTDHDGVFVLTYPGSWEEPDPANPGSTIRVSAPAKRIVFENKLASPMPVDGANMTFMTHEFGHVLGLGHTFGRAANSGPGVLKYEYGSPFDLMSAFVFGGSSWQMASPTFSLPPIDGWPASYTTIMGPRVANAMLHSWEPNLLAGHVHHFKLGSPGSSGKVRIRAAGATSSPDDRTLLMIDPAGDSGLVAGRTYVELRVPTGWDQGLELSGSHEAVAGLAVHGVGADGRCWYRGVVPLMSTDDDLTVLGGGLAIRLDDYSLDDPAGAWADVAWTMGPTTPSAWIIEETSATVVGGTPGEMRTTPCGDSVRWGEWETITTTTFDLETAGFGGAGGPGVSPPTVTWTVDGQVLSGTSGHIAAASSAMAALVEWTVSSGSADLTLTSPPGLAVLMGVSAEVADSSSMVTATAEFDAPGRHQGFDPDQQDVVSDCLVRVLRRLPAGWPLLRLPDPTSVVDVERWRWRADRWLDGAEQRGVDRRLIQAARSLVELATPRRVTR